MGVVVQLAGFLEGMVIRKNDQKKMSPEIQQNYHNPGGSRDSPGLYYTAKLA